MKKLLCRLFGHLHTLDCKRVMYVHIEKLYRLRCTRCGQTDPFRDFL